MGYFKMPDPRRFNHTYIYVDERKEKLQKIEEKAKRDLGLLPLKRAATKSVYEELLRTKQLTSNAVRRMAPAFQQRP